MTASERRDIIDDEYLVVRHSGEIPEIALNSSFHYLTADREGPGYLLRPDEIEILRRGALERFQEIILRDLDYNNRNKTIYRGLQRLLHNWTRYGDFCRRQELSDGGFQIRVLSALHHLFQEIKNLPDDPAISLVCNCRKEHFASFAGEIGISPDDPDFLFCLGFCQP
ncbi:MAG: hypothetical protein ABFS19_12675 [Thermodesulfobacteriota bacterium]